MDYDELKARLKSKVAQGERQISNVFQELGQMPQLFSDEQANEFAIIQKKWKDYQGKKRKGLFYSGEEETASARVLNSLLEFIDELGKEVKRKTEARCITFLAANPGRSAHLRLDVEFREIQQSMGSATHRDAFTLNSRPASRVQDLFDLLLRDKPHILHFAGHGDLSEAQQEGPGKTGQEIQRGLNWEEAAGDQVSFSAGIALIDESNEDKAKIISPQALGELFSHFTQHLQCVILNACYSEAQFEAITPYVPYVIGMKTAISDTFAIDFSMGFYKALGEGRSIPESFALAKAYMKTKNWENLDVIQMISQS